MLRPNWSHSFWLYASSVCTQAVSASKEESVLVHWGSGRVALYFPRLHQLKHTIILTNVNVDRIIFNNASDDFFPDKFSDHSNIWSDKLSDFRPLFQVLITETKVRITTGDKSKMEHTFKKEAFWPARLLSNPICTNNSNKRTSKSSKRSFLFKRDAIISKAFITDFAQCLDKEGKMI